MSRSVAVRLLLVVCLVPALFTACNRDPNVRKQKFLESGNRYRDQGKFREAAIQYSNAVQVDPRFAEAHYQLGEAYLKLKDYQRAFAELSRTADLTPNNYSAQLELANLLIANRQPKDAEPHLDVLREKLNTQIAFVETGQIRAIYPPYAGGLVRVEVIAKCPLTEAASHFYTIAKRVMTGANMDLCFQLWDA